MSIDTNVFYSSRTQTHACAFLAYLVPGMNAGKTIPNPHAINHHLDGRIPHICSIFLHSGNECIFGHALALGTIKTEAHTCVVYLRRVDDF